MTKIHKSWDGKTENHPWHRFPETDNSATHLIIGSFPPNKFTEYKDKLTRCDVEFFYGSKDNGFWELFISSLDLTLKWPDDIETIKTWLYDNNWMVTDIVAKAQRKKNSALDADLIIMDWNNRIIDKLLSNNPIKYIYFTSKWVSDHFHKNIAPKLSSKAKYDETILISPSRNGLRTVSVATYLKYKMPKDETASEFRQRYYRQALGRRANR
jgi:hypothetical protein